MKKNYLTRFISLILAVVLLFSSTTVLSYAFEGVTLSAAEDDEVIGNGDNVLRPADEGVRVQLVRTFDDGYAYSDGFTSVMPKAHKMELVDDGTGDKYLKLTARLEDGKTSTADGYLDFYFKNSSAANEVLIVSLDLIFDSTSGVYPGAVARFRDMNSKTVRALSLDSGGAKFLNNKTKSGYYDKTRHTLTYKIETTKTTSAYTKTYSAYIDGTLLCTTTASSAYKDIESIRIGFFSGAPVGSSFGFDNLRVYSCDTSKVSDPLNVNLGYTMGSASDRLLYQNELFMKVGVDTALLRGTKLSGINEAVTEGTKTFIPVDLLAKYLGYSLSQSGTRVRLSKSGESTVTLNIGSYNATVGSSTVALREAVASVDGRYAVISYRDVNRLFPDYYGSYNDMGVVVVSEIEAYATKASDMALVDVMKRFIFESIDENKKQVNVIDFDTFTSATATHPYILANGEDFAYYKRIYEEGASGSNPVLYSYIKKIVSSASSIYNSYSTEKGGKYVGPTVTPTMPYNDNINNGYDGNGGRQSGADTYAERMQTLAFGYQITGNIKYAQLAYDYAIALGKWEHWGPAHFLNCADAAQPFAVAYDWLYNIWRDATDEEGNKLFDVAKVTEILFTHGVLAGWYGVTGVECPWARRKSYKATATTDSSHFHRMSNNWNAVCSAGMTAAALAIGGDLSTIDTTITVKKATLTKNTGSDADRYAYKYTYENVPFQSLGDHTGLSSYADYAYYLFTRIQYTLPLYGLDFYAPDGSYVESPTYWAYSANNLFALGAYCDSVFGDDFGLITNCWGLDETCYYALNAQSSDYSLWNYSDSSKDLVPGAISTTSFPYVAYQLGLPDLAEMRRDMVASGKYGAGYLDIFYYSESTGEYALPALQYHMESIDGYVARDSWESGATYIAIKGGYNDSAHGQVDSGEFVYHNNGKIWFCDIGTEGYNVSGFGGSVTGYQYYRMNAEGNNTLAITTNPLPIVDGVKQSTTKCCFAGQYSYGTGYMYEVGDNEHGAYALINQTSVYYDNASSAKRGMLFTNDRKTVVIQDEVVFGEAETVYWVGHTYQDIYVTTDGRSAYMTDGVSTIRVSLLSSNSALRFDILSTYDFILEDTFRPDYATTHGTGVAESDRSMFKRLVVKCENVTELDLAVVIEDVTENDDIEVGYTYQKMDSWVPSADTRDEGEVDEVVDFDEHYYGLSTNGALDTIISDFTGSNMLTIVQDEGATVGSYALVKLPRASFSAGTLAGKLLVIDTDIYTDSTAGGLSLSLYSRGGEIASYPLASLTRVGEWAHITIIASSEEIYLFLDGALVEARQLQSAGFEQVMLGASLTSEEGGSISLDNIRVRKLVKDGLSEYIVGGNITDWNGYVGRLREAMPVFSVEIDGRIVYGYTFSSLSLLEYEGKEITIYASTEHTTLYIDKPCTIIHGNLPLRASSPTLSAFISEDRCEFKKDSVTVYWHIGDTVETSEVLGVVYAEYTGTNTSVGKITETVVNGKHMFNTTGWSRTEGGELASAEEMLVTTDNCHFYLVNDASKHPYFYENANGTLIARTSADTLFTDLNAGGKRVILNSDISLTGGGNILTKLARLYLNGYTLTFKETDSTHMFNLKGGNLSIYGGGGAIIKSGPGNIFFPQSYKSYSGVDTILYVEDTTLQASGVFMDHRTAHVYFKNVTFNQTSADDTTLVVQNRTNSMKTEETIPHLTLDGCTINHYGAADKAYAISISKNSSITITGGTHINIPTGIAFRLHNAYTSGGSNEAYIDYTNMSLTVENAHINASCLYLVNLVTSSRIDGIISYSSASSVYSTKIFDGTFKETISEARQEHILNMAGKLSLGNNISLANASVPLLNIADDCKLARQNDAAMPHIISSEYATVSWVAGDNTVVEYWLLGSLPTADNPEVQANIAALNQSVEAGKKYSYSVGIVEGDTTFRATKFDAFSISLSLTLEASMRVNIFVEKRDDVATHGFFIDGRETAHTIITMGDKTYYKVMLVGIIPTSASERHEFTVYVANESGEISPVRIYFSVIEYCENILKNEARFGRDAIDLMANILNYIEAAHRYVGLTDTDEYNTLKTLLGKYQNKVTYSVVRNEEKPDLSGVVDAIRSIQLLLSEAPTFRFNLNKGYTGYLTIRHTSYGETVSKIFTIKDGKCDGRGFIDIELCAYDFTSDIRIRTSGGGEGIYNLKAYYNATRGMDPNLGALLNALYAYSEKAQAYISLTKSSAK